MQWIRIRNAEEKGRKGHGEKKGNVKREGKREVEEKRIGREGKGKNEGIKLINVRVGKEIKLVATVYTLVKKLTPKETQSRPTMLQLRRTKAEVSE